MAARKQQQPVEVENESPATLQGVGDEREATVPDEKANEFIRDLVELFFDQRVQALEQRISDLETLVAAQVQRDHQAEPTNPSLTTATPYAGDVPTYQPPANGDTPWYTPRGY